MFKISSILPIATFLFVTAGCQHENEHNSESDADIANVIQSTTPAKPTSVESVRLTETQIEKYIEIRRAIISMVEDKKVIKTPENKLQLSRFQDIEKFAIHSKGLTEKEYTRIKNLVIDGQTQLKLRNYMKLNNNIISLLEQTLERHNKTRGRVKNKDELALLDQHVEEIKGHIDYLKQTMERYSDRSKSLNENMELLEKYLSQLNAVETGEVSSNEQSEPVTPPEK